MMVVQKTSLFVKSFLSLLYNSSDVKYLCTDLIPYTELLKNNSKLNYFYVVTPKGIAEKTKMTIRFMKLKMTEYDELKSEYEEKVNIK